MLDTAEEAVKVILKEGPAAAMNRFNRKPDEEKISHGSARIRTDQETQGLSVKIRENP